MNRDDWLAGLGILPDDPEGPAMMENRLIYARLVPECDDYLALWRRVNRRAAELGLLKHDAPSRFPVSERAAAIEAALASLWADVLS